VLATAADRHLGGRDFDDVLVQHFKKYILDKYKMDVVREQRRQKTKHNGC
jgi:heat shock protein 4